MDTLIRGTAALLERHPFITSVVLVVAIAVPGIWRVENLAHEANSAADAAQTALESDCRTSNAGRVAAQDTWASVFATLEDLLGPDDQAAVDQLRAGVVLLEPVDCNGDGDIDDDDIAHDPDTTTPRSPP